MKKMFLVAAMSLVGLVAAFAGIDPQKMTLLEAIASKDVSYEMTALGGNQGQTLQIKLENKTAVPMLITVEPGTRMSSADTNQQDLLVVYACEIYIPAFSDKEVKLTAYCCEKKKSSPTEGTKFTVQGMERTNVMKFANYVNDRRFSTINIQNELWEVMKNPGEWIVPSVPSVAPASDTDEPEPASIEL